VGSLAIADQPRDVAHGNRALLDQQLGGGRHPPREQILPERDLAELRIYPLQLPGRGGERPREHVER
jgi:hypothetical protein